MLLSQRTCQERTGKYTLASVVLQLEVCIYQVGCTTLNKVLLVCRYHPHWHGSASVQVQSASGPILVESDVKYLTADRGCLPLGMLLDSIHKRMLYFQAFLFEDAEIIDEP